jgi:hypothetical protein
MIGWRCSKDIILENWTIWGINNKHIVTCLWKIDDLPLGNKSHGIYNDLWRTIVGIIQFYLIIFNNCHSSSPYGFPNHHHHSTCPMSPSHYLVELHQFTLELLSFCFYKSYNLIVCFVCHVWDHPNQSTPCCTLGTIRKPLVSTCASSGFVMSILTLQELLNIE